LKRHVEREKAFARDYSRNKNTTYEEKDRGEEEQKGEDERLDDGSTSFRPKRTSSTQGASEARANKKAPEIRERTEEMWPSPSLRARSRFRHYVRLLRQGSANAAKREVERAELR